MGRRIYIIPKCVKEENAVENAKRFNCTEIVSGVPPALMSIIDSDSLPIVYEEPLPTPAEPKRNFVEELNELLIATDLNKDKLAEFVIRFNELEAKVDLTMPEVPK